MHRCVFFCLASGSAATPRARARRDRGHTSSQMFLNSFAREFCTTLFFCIFFLPLHYSAGRRVPFDEIHKPSASPPRPLSAATSRSTRTHRPRPRSRHRSSRPDAFGSTVIAKVPLTTLSHRLHDVRANECLRLSRLGDLLRRPPSRRRLAIPRTFALTFLHRRSQRALVSPSNAV